MQIIKIKPQSFCKGVANAIHILNIAMHKNNLSTPIYMLGGIVHNNHIINAYKNMGIIIVDSLDNLDPHGTLIITAHGISNKKRQEINDLGLNIIDTTCSEVEKIQVRVNDKIKSGYDVIYYGIAKHAECQAIMEDNPTVHLIQSIEDVSKLNIKNNLIYFCSQTTMSYLSVVQIEESIKNRYSTCYFDHNVCTATKDRQEALIENAKICDLIIVVGDKTSNNTNNLKKIAAKYTDTIMINSIDEARHINLSGINILGITSGASTPALLVDEIIKTLNDPSYLSIIQDKNYI